MTPLALLAVAGVALLAFGSRRAPATPRATAERPLLTTTHYAAGKVAMLRARYNDARIRAAVDRWGEVFTPGVPTVAVIALGASSEGADEQLNRPPGAWGLFGVEPSWIDSHGADERTQADLRRTVTRATYRRDIEGQVYLGLRRYAVALTDARSVGAEVNLTRWNAWEYQCAVCCYSAGQGILRQLLRLAPAAARHTPRGVRWTRIAEDTLRTIVADRSQTLAWGLVRPRERYAAALALRDAVDAPADDAFFTDLATWPTAEDLSLSNLAHRRN